MLDWAVKVSKAQSAESECLSYQDHLATGSDWVTRPRHAPAMDTMTTRFLNGIITINYQQPALGVRFVQGALKRGVRGGCIFTAAGSTIDDRQCSTYRESQTEPGCRLPDRLPPTLHPNDTNHWLWLAVLLVETQWQTQLHVQQTANTSTHWSAICTSNDYYSSAWQKPSEKIVKIQLALIFSLCLW